MEIKQVYELVDQTTEEVLGKTGILQEDLTGVVQLGEEIFNANAQDAYVRALVNHIGKVIFVNRPYAGSAPRVLMDSWEFGSVLEKVQMDTPEAQENETWELNDGASYDPNLFYKPKISVKFFNGMVTFEVPISITEKQVKQSFSNATQLNSFVSMIYNGVDRAMTLKIDSLVMRTINNMVAETIKSDYPNGNYTATSGVKAINLLKLYKDAFPTTENQSLTAKEALVNKDFLRFASTQIRLYIKRLGKMSSLFNIGGKDRFTPRDYLHVVLLADFAVNVTTYLQSDTFHDEMVALPNYDEVPYWQGSGLKYDFEDTSKIDIKTSAGNAIELTGVLGVMFDRDALGINNYERRVTTDYNAKAEFWNQWHKFDCRYFNDFNENMIVFIAQ